MKLLLRENNENSNKGAVVGNYKKKINLILLKEQSCECYTKDLIGGFSQRSIHKFLLKEKSCILLHSFFISMQSLPHFHTKDCQSRPIA